MVWGGFARTIVRNWKTTSRSLLQSVGGSEETQQSWEDFVAKLRTLYAVTASPAERDADRLEEYLSNFSMRGQKAMVAELWTKGSASFQRLTNLRGQYSVTANADRNAIDRLVAKAEVAVGERTADPHHEVWFRTSCWRSTNWINGSRGLPPPDVKTSS